MKQQKLNHTTKNQLLQSSKCQRQQIYEWLLTSKLTTILAREELGVMHPAARAQELRARGHNILARLRSIKTSSGVHHHNIIEYSLLASGD